MKNIKLNKVVKNFISLTFANVLGQVLMFISVVYTAQYFGPDNFGIINFSNVVIMYFTALASLGLQSLCVLEIAKSKKNNDSKINTILSLKLILAAIVYILVIILAFTIKKSMVYKLNILFYGLTIFPNAIYVDWIFNANEEMQYNSRSIIIKNLVYSLMVIVALKFFKINNLYYLALFMFLSTLISSLYLLKVAKRHYNMNFKFIFDIKEYKRLISNSWPFFFSGIFATINSTIATLMLGLMRTDYEIGIYNSVYKIVNVFILVVGILFTPVYPLLIRYYNEKQTKKLSVLVNNLRKIMYMLAIPLLFVSFILNKEIILTLYGDKYKDGYSVFTILFIYVALLCIREIYGYELNAWNLQKKYMKVVLLSSIYNIISNFVFIKYYGIEGAAINTLISEIINLVLMFKISRSVVKIKYKNNFIAKIIISSIIMCIIILASKIITHNAIVLSGVGIVVYLSLLFMTKTISITEIKENVLTK
jgi:O-antigen/teichoic acid export membrane protein